MSEGRAKIAIRLTFVLISAFAVNARAQSGSADRASKPASDYIGSARCAVCHAREAQLQNQSEHAHALSRPADHALASRFTPAKTFIRSGKYRFRFFRNANQISVRAWDDSRQIEIPLEWAFGAGSQAVTFVAKANPAWYLEQALSFYSAAGSFAGTPGQPAPAEDTLPAALGRLFASEAPDADMRRCFQCHSTGPVARKPDGELVPSEPGVHCEACHGAGASHAALASAGKIERARASIKDPARMTATELNTFCGNCHRQPAQPGVKIDFKVAWNVRHQPIYLNAAVCFRKSAGALSCLTCHDPHTRLRQDDAFYNSKCEACHNEHLRRPAAVCMSKTSADCVGCHMPRISPQSWLRFTNHWIGIYGEGNKLTPLRQPMPE